MCIRDRLAENEKLEARAKASEKGKMKDTMERAKLKSELDNLQRLVDRIPPDILAEDVYKRQVKKLGVKIETNVVIGKSMTIDQLLEDEGFDAVFIGSGAGLPRFCDFAFSFLRFASSTVFLLIGYASST